MIKNSLPLVIPSYICKHPSFDRFMIDLFENGISKVVLTVDYDISNDTVAAHKRKLRDIKKYLSAMSCSKTVKFKLVTNFLLGQDVCNVQDVLPLKNKKSDFIFITFPIFASPDSSMQNIFLLKNAGFVPVINDFDKLLISYPRSFCNSVISTENISFIFDVAALEKNRSELELALGANNSVLFSSTDLTASVIDGLITDFSNSLQQELKMRLGYSSHQLIKELF